MLNKLPPYNFDQHYVKLVETNTYFLEMKNPNSEQVEIPDSVIFQKLATPLDVNQCRFYYFSVGKDWDWLDRMVMPDK